MKNVTFILASLMMISTATTFAAKPIKEERSKKPVREEKVAKVNPVIEQCIMPFREEMKLLVQQRKEKFSEIKSSFRSGEISEADLGALLEEASLEVASLRAALETTKEACLAELEKGKQE